MSMIKYCAMIFDPNYLELIIIEIYVNIISAIYVSCFNSICLMSNGTSFLF